MPLIQWIMQNLGLKKSKYSYVGQGLVVVYDQFQNATFTETHYALAVKFAIGDKYFDAYGSVWTITGMSVFSNSEVVYTAKRGFTIKNFSDSEIFVNQISPNDLINKLDRMSVFSNSEVVYTAKRGFTIKNFSDSEIFVNQISPNDLINKLDRMEEILDSN